VTQRTYQLADVLELMADVVGEREAVVTEDRTLTFSQLDERSTRLAHHLADLGVVRGDRVGIHATNCTEWVEAFYATMKLGAAPVNVNFRYVAEELRYLYDNAGCRVTVTQPEYTAVLDEIADDLPDLAHRVVIGPDYEAALAVAPAERDFEPRSPDDLYLIYTGGTTGMPKGVMWRHEDLIFGALNASRFDLPVDSPEQFATEAAANPGPLRLMALGPMMHGGGQWIMGNAHVAGGTLVLYTGRTFDPAAVWDLAARAGVHSIGTIGDAMARPLAEALAAPGRPDWDLSALVSIGNGGAPLSAAVRTQLREVLPAVMIRDSYGASETGAATARFDDGESHSSPRFDANATTTVLNVEEARVCDVGEVGMLARRGHIPLGYWGDPTKTAATFTEVDGVRWVVPGDYARFEDDGTISLLGRGSVSINTGGEKVYPEEVEAALLHHPAVLDAVVVGTPSERWGEQVTALVQLRPGVEASADDVRAEARVHVADYKVPKDVLFVDQVVRTPVGKADYVWAKAAAIEALGAD
jgi:acyl-CoA synthetase (AMP-forming)/AMP-acid ligase II